MTASCPALSLKKEGGVKAKIIKGFGLPTRMIEPLPGSKELLNLLNPFIMKKLGKITISPEKIMKNEELINLQGGYQGWCCFCEGHGIMYASTQDQCTLYCDLVYNAIGYWSSEC